MKTKVLSEQSELCLEEILKELKPHSTRADMFENTTLVISLNRIPEILSESGIIEKSLTKHTEDKEAPMGVSQWKEYGKKYKYWNFFVEEVLKDLIGQPTGYLVMSGELTDEEAPAYDKCRQQIIDKAKERYNIELNK